MSHPPRSPREHSPASNASTTWRSEESTSGSTASSKLARGSESGADTGGLPARPRPRAANRATATWLARSRSAASRRAAWGSKPSASGGCSSAMSLMPFSVHEPPSIVAASAAASGTDWQLPICGGRSCTWVPGTFGWACRHRGQSGANIVATLSRNHLRRQVVHVGVKVRLDVAIGRASLHRAKPAFQIRECVVRAHTEPLVVRQACCHPLEKGREEAIDESQLLTEKEGPSCYAQLAHNECKQRALSGHSEALRGTPRHSEALRGHSWHLQRPARPRP